jgi:hypothetical protein
MAKIDDLIKYITERVITYFETPKEVRKQTRVSQKEQKEQWQYRWFGMLPLALRMWCRYVRKKKNTPPNV